MTGSNIIRTVLSFIVFLLLQIFIGKNLVLFGMAFSFIYLGFLLSIPFETGKLLMLTLGFLAGVIIDIFYDSLGLHAAACVLMMFVRPYVTQLITPRGGYEAGAIPSLKVMGFGWYFRYGLILIFVHHLLLFYLEAATFRFFFFTLSKVILSTLFTFCTIVIIQLLFYRKPQTVY